MKLGHVIVYVPNVINTVRFYEQAFGLRTRFIHDSNEYAEMETGTTALSFVDETMLADMLQQAGSPFEQLRPTKTPPGIELTFITKTVQEAFDRAVAHGATAIKQPTQTVWGQTISYVRDNNGALVEIASPITE